MATVSGPGVMALLPWMLPTLSQQLLGRMM